MLPENLRFRNILGILVEYVQLRKIGKFTFIAVIALFKGITFIALNFLKNIVSHLITRNLH